VSWEQADQLPQVVGDNKDGLTQHVEQTANRLLAVERTVAIGIPNSAKMDELGL